MRWQDIKNSPDNTGFLFEGKQIFGKTFIEVLKFHPPGIAPVKDESGSYHISTHGKPLYDERYDRTFGFYCNRAAVIENANWFHVNESGKRAYPQSYAWCGNYQEDLCTVRDFCNRYFHIDLDGNEVYKEKYLYCGDFRDGFSCAKLQSGFFKHIDRIGNFINDKEFLDLGVFHKNFATARDKDGWFHIDINGEQIYSRRFANIEPFYNGQAKAEMFDGSLEVIDEAGKTVVNVSAGGSSA